MSLKKKLLLIALIIGILGAVFGIGAYNARSHTPPHTVAERFYRSWLDALKNGGDPLKEGLQHKSTYVTDTFAQEVDHLAKQGHDGVLCTGTQPKNFVLEATALNKDGIHASIDFVADGTNGHIVLARDMRGWWHIDEVDCPANAQEVPIGTTTATTSVVK
jgi:hypothetical protein